MGLEARAVGAKMAFRRITAAMRPLPEVILGGPSRSGSTSLFEFLSNQPWALPATRKETHMLSFNWTGDAKSYRALFPSAASCAKARLSEGVSPAAIEASPDYLSSVAAARRAARITPWALVVFTLRDPIARAYSSFTKFPERYPHERFADQVEADIARIEAALEAGEWSDERSVALTYETALYESLYALHLAEWKRVFRPEGLLVLSSERLFAGEEPTFEALRRALGPARPVTGRLPQLNAAHYNDGISKETYTRLEAFFRPYNARLFEMLNDDFGWPS